MGRISGCLAVSHGGGEAVAVARSTAIPAACRRSITSSNQAKFHSPSAGSRCAHEKMPTDTIVTPASRMSRMSSSHTSRGHCSGL